jgi:aspartate/methionine/tyrosine aminotransferase
MTLSSRVPRGAAPNQLTLALARLQADGVDVTDLTESNPTLVGLPYPNDLLAPLGGPSGLRYEPMPLGLPAARAAVAADQMRRGAAVSAERVVLTASTSEAYAWLFKLLCDPGEAVLVPRPSYPLFDYLARAEGVATHAYNLRFHGRWEVDLGAMASAPAGIKALVAVSPNNPTGSCLEGREVQELQGICRDRGWALIVDEVFADYLLESPAARTDLAANAPVLTFTLGGASKTLGLPQVKLGWIVVGGPETECGAALDGLEHIADTYLSVSTPVQLAAASLLRSGGVVRDAIVARVSRNLARAREIATAFPACTVLPVEGGWTAVVRVPSLQSEEALALSLLEREHVLAHPGYFFDFDAEAFLVVSLLPAEARFRNGFERMLRHACTPP